MSTRIWTPERLEKALAALVKAKDPGINVFGVGSLVSKALGLKVTGDGVRKAFAATGWPSPVALAKGIAKAPTNRMRKAPLGDHLEVLEDEDETTSQGFREMSAGMGWEKDDSPDTARSQQIIESVKDDRFAKLVEIVKKHERKEDLTLEALCDEMGDSPSHVRALVEAAKGAGYALEVHHGLLVFASKNALQQEVVAEEQMKPGTEIEVGVLSDPHFASKHHERGAVEAHMRMLDDRGIKHILSPGDIVAGGGRYRFLRYEVTSTGIEDQCTEATDFFSQFPQFQFHVIAGNHDESFDVGIDAVAMIRRQMIERGHNNWHYYGQRAARIRLLGVRWGMWHPGGGISYAKSYRMQKYIENMPPDDRPAVLLIGHWHQFLWALDIGVHGFLCGTFENGDSSFGRMIGGDVALGGLVLRMRVGEDGKVEQMRPEWHTYPRRKMVYVDARGMGGEE